MRTFNLLALLALCITLMGSLTVAAPAPQDSESSGPPVGQVTDATINGNPFEGATFAIKNFVAGDDNTLKAQGILHAVYQGQTIAEPITLPVRSINDKPVSGLSRRQLSCSILNLDLGPLNLNLLGLVVDLNEVILVLRAVPGANALLGNLLCAVTGLLDAGGLLSSLVGSLNQILGLLGVLNL
ncbi:hypothetical protein HDV00_009234 [Rhizophlyctis rosea]|nr:hypothetical protein HDV00_009234 [Rhizophlyctis rosea]